MSRDNVNLSSMPYRSRIASALCQALEACAGSSKGPVETLFYLLWRLADGTGYEDRCEAAVQQIKRNGI